METRQLRNCKVCGKPLLKHQKSTCSWDHRRIYVNSLNKGRVSEFKGMANRWTDEQRRQIGDAQRGVPKSEEFKQKCRKRMSGVAFFKGHHHTQEAKNKISRPGDKHYNWKGDDKPYRAHGITIGEFKIRIAKQKGLCAICGVKMTRGTTEITTASLDHDHSSGSNRGILCKRCNLLIGIAHDNTSVLSKAIDYLNSWTA
jgi:hypothetical protein